MPIPNKADLENMKQDIDDLEQIVNTVDDTDITTRLGKVHKSLTGRMNDLQAQLDAKDVEGQAALATAKDKLTRYAAINYTGDFVASTAYEANDVWKNTADGSLWIVPADYTSGATAQVDIDAKSVRPHQDRDRVEQVRSLEELKLVVPAYESQTFSLSAVGRSGKFETLSAGDYSAEIASDPLGGVYVELNIGQVLRRKFTGKVKAEWFGLIDDPSGSIDQYAEIQACADFCKTYGYEIECSSSFYSDSDTNGPVLFYTSITFLNDATVVYKDQTTTVVKFTNAIPAIELTPASISGFDEYSIQITGLPTHAAGDFLVIDSAETLIERLNSPLFPFYRKREMTVLADGDGRLAIPIMETYDMGLVVDGGYTGSIKLYRREPVLNIKNFKMKTNTGLAIDCNVDGLVIAEHRYIVHEDTEFVGIRNDYSNWKNYECLVANVRPVMDGDWDNSIGYGIYNFATAMSVTTDGQLTRFRHAIAGRHDKNTTVRGGYYDKDIDSHYGYFMKVRDLQMNGTFSFCGCDFSAKGITQYLTDTTGLFAERTDTPETRGTITLEDIDLYADISQNNGNIFCAVFGAQYNYTFFRDLRKPDVVNIDNIRIHNISGYYTIKLLAHFRPDDYNYESFGEINISNVSQIGTDNVMEAISFLTKGDTQTWTRNTVINLSNIGRVSTRIQNNETTFDDSYGYVINANSIRELSLRADMNAIAGGKLSSCGINFLSNDSTSDFSITDTIGKLYIDNSCEFSYTSRQALWPILRGTFKHFIEKDTADKWPLLFKEYGKIELLMKDDPWGSGAANFDENNNHCSTVWDDRFDSGGGVTSGFTSIDDTQLNGTTGADNDVTVSCRNYFLYLENRRGSEGVSRELFLKLETVS